MTEAALQSKIIKDLKDRGYIAFKAGGASANGVSDIVACAPGGQFIAIEVKAPGKLSTLSALQARFIGKICQNGGKAFSCDSFAMYLEKLGGLDEKTSS